MTLNSSQHFDYNKTIELFLLNNILLYTFHILILSKGETILTHNTYTMFPFFSKIIFLLHIIRNLYILCTTNYIVENTKKVTTMKYETKKFKKFETFQTRWNNFKYEIINDFNKNKEELKGTKLDNGMTITGIGEKCLKIENNFYRWEDICNVAIEDEETDDIILKEIINYIFEDSRFKQETDNYTTRKFEVHEDFEAIREEILAHKQHYNKGNITEIGETSIKLWEGYDAEYLTWETLRGIVEDAKTHTFDELEKIVSWRYINTFKELFNENKEVYTRQDLKLLEKGETKLLTLFRMYRRGELTYIAIQDIADNEEEIRMLLEKVFRWTRGRTIPLEFRKGKVYYEVGKRGDLNPHKKDEDLTETLHRREYLEEYYVANVPHGERDFFICSEVKSHDVTSIIQPSCRIIKLHNAHLYYLNDINKHFKDKELEFATSIDDNERNTRDFIFYNDDNEENLCDETEKIATDLLMYHIPCDKNPYTDFEELWGENFNEEELDYIFEEIKEAIDEIEEYEHGRFIEALHECYLDYISNAREYIADFNDEYILQYYMKGDDEE